MKKVFTRLLALLTVLALLVLPAAALTRDQAAELLRNNYVDPIPEEVLSQPTVEAMLAALGDPYTEYLSAESYRRFLDSMADDSLVGIGVSIDGALTAEDDFLLQDVFEDGPAAKGGLCAGDIIVGVDHKSVQGMEPDDIIAMIRGQEGTPVAITYLREGRRHSVTLIRETVYVPSTTGQMMEDGVCYIKCSTWGEETPGYFQQIIRANEAQTGCWLIDLRNNTGGLTDAAALAAGLFCGPGDKVLLRRYVPESGTLDGYVYEPFASRGAAATEKPVVILTNGRTASASEAFCAALRDYGVAVVVGQRTYGKGVAQGLWDKRTNPALFPDGDALKITIARFYSPLGNTNDTLGILPDVPVEDLETFSVGLGLACAFAEQPETWQSFTAELLEAYIRDSAFPDTDQSPYEHAVSALRAYGLVAGKGDERYHPEDPLTRSELAQMLVNALNSWVPENAARFADVPADAWYAEAVAAIAAQGMMEGTGPDVFSPDAVLTRQELFTVMGRLARWLNDNLGLVARRAGPDEWDLRVLQDYADWAKGPVWLLSCTLENSRGGLVNLLWDDPEYIDPAAPATRGEAAAVLYNLLHYLTLLP